MVAWSPTGNAMTEELLKARIVELRKALDQVQANGNALVGAIQECEMWLAKLAEKHEVNHD